MPVGGPPPVVMKMSLDFAKCPLEKGWGAQLPEFGNHSFKNVLKSVNPDFLFELVLGEK